MEKLTYKQAYNKIIDAYFKDEIKPFDIKFCFCGTLNWPYSYTGDNPYVIGEYRRMESALLEPLNGHGILCNFSSPLANEIMDGDSRFEEKLFEGMSAALDVLKQIHKERGENVDDTLPLTKRVLNT